MLNESSLKLLTGKRPLPLESAIEE